MADSNRSRDSSQRRRHTSWPSVNLASWPPWSRKARERGHLNLTVQAEEREAGEEEGERTGIGGRDSSAFIAARQGAQEAEQQAGLTGQGLGVVLDSVTSDLVAGDASTVDIAKRRETAPGPENLKTEREVARAESAEAREARLQECE